MLESTYICRNVTNAMCIGAGRLFMPIQCNIVLHVFVLKILKEHGNAFFPKCLTLNGLRKNVRAPTPSAGGNTADG